MPRYSKPPQNPAVAMEHLLPHEIAGRELEMQEAAEIEERQEEELHVAEVEEERLVEHAKSLTTTVVTAHAPAEARNEEIYQESRGFERGRLGRQRAFELSVAKGASSADQESTDTIIEEVAMDAEAEANKIAAEEAAKTASEDAAKGPAGETGKAAAEEAGKGPVGEVGKAATEEGMDLLAERKLELVMKQANIENAQDEAREQATKDEAARHHHQDEEIGKLVAQRTQELEQKHKEALDAQALVHASKVKELEVELDGLKEQALKVAKEKDTLNGFRLRTSEV
nr:tol-Pal system protein TolA-like [Aegilops tauschii subsp. strangulata]